MPVFEAHPGLPCHYGFALHFGLSDHVSLKFRAFRATETMCYVMLGGRLKREGHHSLSHLLRICRPDSLVRGLGTPIVTKDGWRLPPRRGKCGGGRFSRLDPTVRRT